MRPFVRICLVLLASATTVSGTAGAGMAYNEGDPTAPDPEYGPTVPYTKVLDTGGNVMPLVGKARIDAPGTQGADNGAATNAGWIFRSGQQSDKITLSLTADRAWLRFADATATGWSFLPDRCRAEPVSTGVSAVCPVKTGTTEANPTLVEVWPRLGDDSLDATRLPAAYQVTFLGDAGKDSARFGPGRDFGNGAFQDDLYRGGPGADWIRTGTENDTLYGGPGNDKLVGAEGNDRLEGGIGTDRIYGSDGADTFSAKEGTKDSVYGGPGSDSAIADAIDGVWTVESRS